MSRRWTPSRRRLKARIRNGRPVTFDQISARDLEPWLKTSGLKVRMAFRVRYVPMPRTTEWEAA